MKKTLLIVFFVTIGSVVFAGGPASYGDLRSPRLLGGGPLITGADSPQLDSLNPSASAGIQRVTLDLSYIALALDNSIEGWKGHVVNLGATLPTKAGVLNFSGDFITTPAYQTLNYGTQFDLRASFSKELYPKLYSGIGLKGTFGEGWGIAGDIGIIHFIGNMGPFENFRWALALQELGYHEKTKTTAPLYSLTGGVALDIFNNEKFRWGIGGDISVPTFKNLRFTLGIELNFMETLSLRAASRFNIGELGDNEIQGMIPSVSLFYTHRPSNLGEKNDGSEKPRLWQRGESTVSTGAAPLGNGLWGFGFGLNFALGAIDRQPPAIKINSSGFRFAPDRDEGAKTKEGTDGGDENGEPAPDETSQAPGSEDTFPLGQKGGLASLINKNKTPKKAISLEKFSLKSRRVPQRIQSENKISTKGLVKDPAAFEAVPVVDYISPNNDGIYDTLEFPLSIKDSRYIEGFALVIQNSAGKIVRRIANKDERPENAGFLGFFARLFSVEQGLDIPKSLRWDGTSDAGEVVPDGKYLFFVQAWDDNGNMGASDALGIEVDTKAPELELIAPEGLDLIFSPDGDGNKDFLPVKISGSPEDNWSLTILTAGGREVRRFQWKNAPPESLQWDGKDQEGVRTADGVYRLAITSTDRGGNTTSSGFENIIINTIPTPIGLSISSPFLSPGNEEAISQIEFGLDVPVTQGILNWTLHVLNATENEMNLFAGKGPPPSSYVYRGTTSGGAIIPEDIYFARLKLHYANGARPEAESARFTVDTTRPFGALTLESRIFSPNGDNRKDILKIYQESSEEDLWYGVIKSSAGVVVKSFEWIQRAEAQMEWDGYTDDGKLAEDGIYTYRLYSTDKAGNKGSSDVAQFSLDTEDTPVVLSAVSEVFSPNGDGVKETLILSPQLRVAGGISRYSIVVEDEAGATVREFTGTGALSEQYKWDGFGLDGRRVADGPYRARLEVVYDKGNVSKAYSRSFFIDTQFPEASLKTEYLLFSPDGDEQKDRIRIRQTVSQEDLWVGSVKNQAGEIVKEVLWKGTTGDFIWAAEDNNGNKVPDGVYTYTLSSEDSGGNRTEVSLDKITIDTTPVNVYITASAEGFSPNGTGAHEDISFDILIPNKTGISRWQMDILDQAGRIVRSYEDQRLPTRIVWDGTGNKGSPLPDGTYTPRISLEYLKGSKPQAETPPIILDTQPPNLNLGLAPIPFSPDNDGVEDELNLTLQALDLTAIVSWELSIYDRTGKKFKGFDGFGLPSDLIRWDGRGDNGDLVISAEDYRYRYSAIDPWGSETVQEGIIPVDVLVVRVGNLLKIQIASIQFAPDSPRLSEDSPEVIERNKNVLLRLSKILRKYDSYGITIEGHAASIFWNNAAKAQKEEVEELQPLSLQRAETVKNYLVRLGIPEKRINTVGRGGTSPVVPHSDGENRWKNRRVEFLLEK